MSDEKCCDQSERIATLEKEAIGIEGRMNALKAELEGAMNTQQTALSNALNELRADFANFKADMANQSKADTRWIMGIFAVVIGLGIGIAGIFLRLPLPS